LTGGMLTGSVEFHSAPRARLIELESSGVILWASRQVIREFLAVTTRSGAVLPPPASTALSQMVRQFEAAFQIADEDAAVTTLLLDLLKARTIQGKQIHDANIVATMRRRSKRTWVKTYNFRDTAARTKKPILVNTATREEIEILLRSGTSSRRPDGSAKH
jgi:predicted nucleic acid-binding protein